MGEGERGELQVPSDRVTSLVFMYAVSHVVRQYIHKYNRYRGIITPIKGNNFVKKIYLVQHRFDQCTTYKNSEQMSDMFDCNGTRVGFSGRVNSAKRIGSGLGLLGDAPGLKSLSDTP